MPVTRTSATRTHETPHASQRPLDSTFTYQHCGCAHHTRGVMAGQALDAARAHLLVHTDGIPVALVTACSNYYASAATCVAQATSLAVVCAETVSIHRFKDQLQQTTYDGGCYMMDPQKMHAPVCRNQVLSPPKQSLCRIACQTTLIASDSDSSGSCNTQMADTDDRHGAVRPTIQRPM